MKTRMLLAIFAFSLMTISTVKSWHRFGYYPSYGYGSYGYYDGYYGGGCRRCNHGYGWWW